MHERPFPGLLPAALLAALLIAVLAAGTAVTRAQAPEQPSPATETDAADGESADQSPGAAPPDSAAAGQPTGPLEDYEASEQISEDLSVSFPVDI